MTALASVSAALAGSMKTAAVNIAVAPIAASLPPYRAVIIILQFKGNSVKGARAKRCQDIGMP